VGKRLNAKDICKEMFPVYGWKCLTHKVVHSFIEKFYQGRSKVADAQPRVQVAEITVKRLLRCGLQCTGKAMEQVYQCWWRMCREINVLSMFEYHMFYVLYRFVTYLLTHPHNYEIIGFM
jgi:hypothetical protein